jgi:uncharacterized protein
VVLDTHIVLDALLFNNAEVAPLWSAVCAGQWRWIATASMREEFARQCTSIRFSKWKPDSEHMLTQFDAWATLLPEPQLPPTVARRFCCSDPDDQIFIDLALARQASWLVTRDRALLALARRARALPWPLRVLRPAELMRETSMSPPAVH